jgi:hypothetical protein
VPQVRCPWPPWRSSVRPTMSLRPWCRWPRQPPGLQRPTLGRYSPGPHAGPV